jgi:outer membrane protein assembly factor BamA
VGIALSFEHLARHPTGFLCGLVLLAVTLLATGGCVRKDFPARAQVVADVSIEDADKVDPDPVLDGLSTAASPRFLGIWDGVLFEYEVLDESLLERDLERFERYYRARGYYEAKVTAARVVQVDEHRVKVEIRVHEGEPVLVGQVSPLGLELIPIEDAAAALRVIDIEPGQPFDEALFDRSKQRITNTLGDRGYAFARVTASARIDIATHRAEVSFQIEPGDKAVYGPVVIEGLEAVPEHPVRANLLIEEGEPYSLAELEDARVALINLGVFATVEVIADRSRPETREVPVRVRVRESALRTLRLGGGMRFDVLEWSGHLSIGWEHRNFLGGMRRFSIDTKPGLVFFPTRMDHIVAPTEVLPKNRARMELRQPAFIEGRTTGLIRGEFNIYPLLYPGLGETRTDENIIGYQEVVARTGVERAFFRHHLFVTPTYNWQANFPFMYRGVQPAGLDRVIVSFPELYTVLDLRDDPIDPRSGAFFANSLQVAGYVFGGDATDIKVQPEARTYVPISRTVTFATRATVGFVFPQNYGETLRAGQAPTDANDPAAIQDQQLLLFRAFYSGGPNSNRGYPFRGVGPHGVLGFLLPATVSCDLGTQDPECFRPLGGLSLWEASLEVRFPVFGPLRATTFLDASDVTREVATLRFDFPHLSPGLGLRYATPVGPIRLDIGYRLPFAQQIGAASQRLDEGRPGTILGLPVAVHFGLGEAF